MNRTIKGFSTISTLFFVLGVFAYFWDSSTIDVTIKDIYSVFPIYFIAFSFSILLFIFTISHWLLNRYRIIRQQIIYDAHFLCTTLSIFIISFAQKNMKTEKYPRHYYRFDSPPIFDYNQLLEQIVAYTFYFFVLTQVLFFTYTIALKIKKH